MTTALTPTQGALVAQPLVGLPTEADWDRIVSMGATLAQSGLVPVKTPEAAAAIVLKGAELGIAPMQSFSHISVIQGKPTCSAELQLALLARGGVEFRWINDGSDGTAVIEFSHPKRGTVCGQFSMDDAKRAGLATKDNWKKWPRNMLRARAISDGARAIGADFLAGMSYTPEEMGAEVDEEGRAVSGSYSVEAPPEDGDGGEIPQFVAQPDAEKLEKIELWDSVKALKAKIDDDVWYTATLKNDHGVIVGETKAGEIDLDTLRAIVDTLTDEITSRAPAEAAG